jgi:hypothetical protein
MAIARSFWALCGNATCSLAFHAVRQGSHTRELAHLQIETDRSLSVDLQFVSSSAYEIAPNPKHLSSPLQQLCRTDFWSIEGLFKSL